WAAVEWLAARAESSQEVLHTASAMKPFREYRLAGIPSVHVLDADALILSDEPGLLLSEGGKPGEAIPPDPIVRFDRPEQRLRRITRSRFYHVVVSNMSRAPRWSSGWSAPSHRGDELVRVMEGRSSLQIEGVGASAWLKLEIERTSSARVTLWWNEGPLATHDLAPGRGTLRHQIPAERQQPLNTLTIEAVELAGDQPVPLTLIALSFGPHPH
ncbi:MAG TPA: hypothetical protein VM534_04745, partial [Thermoanaerobaculia bacterium]|nr:hypothetical protein [Thermoanaerobaculia bacterium]